MDDVGMNIYISNDDLKQRLREMNSLKEKAPKILKNSINSTLGSMKTLTVNSINSNYYIDKSYIKGKIKLRKVINDLGSGYIYSNHRPIFVNRFEHTPNATPSRKGAPPVFVNVKRSEGGGYIQGAFVAPIKNKRGSDTGKLGVFVRTNKVGKYKGTNKVTRAIHGFKNTYQQIESVYGPGVTSMMNNQDVQEIVFEKTTQKLDKALDKRIKNAIGGK